MRDLFLGAIIAVLFGGVLGLMAMSFRTSRARRGAPEYTPEHPAVSRLASKEEIEALITKAGIRVVRKEDVHG